MKTAHSTTRRHVNVATVIGDLTVVGADGCIEGVYFPGHWHRPAATTLGRRVPDSDDTFSTVIEQLHEYLAGQRRAFDVPLRLRGEPAQQRVWDLIARVPYGTTTTYGRLAADLDGGLDARQVGAAVGRNPISIIVPCHRVVGSTGKLTGYAGGLRRKRFLLELELAGCAPSQPSLLGPEALA